MSMSKQKLFFIQRDKLIAGDVSNKKIKAEEHRSQKSRIKMIIMCTSLIICVLLLFYGEFSEIDILDVTKKIGDLFLEVDYRDMSGVRFYKDIDNGTHNDIGKDHIEKESNDATDGEPDIDEPIIDTLAPTDRYIYNYDPNLVPEDEDAIIPMDISLYSLGSNYISNQTGYVAEVKEIISNDFTFFSDVCDSTLPLVLIMHTHGSEGYSEEGQLSYARDAEIARSLDITQNVVSIGKLIADTFNENGVGAIHCQIMHDAVQYKDSYFRSAETIKEYLREYPSIKLVIDIHRDSVIKSDGSYVRAVTSIEGEPAAQVMFVVGSDWGGNSCESWSKNLALSLKLRESLNSKYENLVRPVKLGSSSYNQELSEFGMLIEVGTSGNSIAEAKYSAKLIAEELCKMIKNEK